jgi:hypothetical protein
MFRIRRLDQVVIVLIRLSRGIGRILTGSSVFLRVSCHGGFVSMLQEQVESQLSRLVPDSLSMDAVGRRGTSMGITIKWLFGYCAAMVGDDWPISRWRQFGRTSMLPDHVQLSLFVRAATASH